MINKKEIFLNFEEDDRALVLNLYEKLRLALDRDITTFGNDFYPPNVWSYFQNKVKVENFSIESFGFFEESERRMISFNNIYNVEFPMKIIKIEKTSKFNKVSHRDYLGAILSLGIKRSKFGDLIVQDDFCYVALCEEIEDYIINNLKSIGKSPCRVTKIKNIVEVPSIDFKEEVILVQTLRVDSIVSKIAKVSRSQAQEMIEEGRVLVDYNRVKEKSKEVKTDERITVRGIGKFILGNIIGKSKSDKYKVIIKKYT